VCIDRCQCEGSDLVEFFGSDLECVIMPCPT
jgi:hypothetical protein